MIRSPNLSFVLFVAAGAMLATWLAWLSGMDRTQRLRRRLLNQMRFGGCGPALQAIAQLGRMGWLYDGSLRGAILTGSNLAGINLVQANLSRAWLGYSSFQDCCMSRVNLESTDLRVSNMKGTDLSGAYLHKANLRDAIFDTTTRLPDGSAWLHDTDMDRFTDPGHPQFWHPSAVYSRPHR